jgi:dinuclear metal center YbgI/SA1388 family protein
MFIYQITDFLETLAPLSYQESYDNCGLIIGDKNAQLLGALITLDVTEEVIDEAIQKKCNLILAHHPLVFSGLKKITGKNYVERAVIKAIKNDVAVYAIHTNLDNMSDGVNAKICQKLGLVKTSILQPKSQLFSKLITFVPKDFTAQVQQAIWQAGAGNIGNYSECSFVSEGQGTFTGNQQSQAFVGTPNSRHTESEHKLEVIFPSYLKTQIIAALENAHPYEEVAFNIFQLSNEAKHIGAGMIGQLPTPIKTTEWLAYLKKHMEVTCIRHTNFDKEFIQTIAVCGGAGSFLLGNAIAQKADVFVTGDFKYHEFFNAENALMICDIGHYESERFTSEMLMEKLLEKFTTFAPQISSINTNPVNYYI